MLEHTSSIIDHVAYLNLNDVVNNWDGVPVDDEGAEIAST